MFKLRGATTGSRPLDEQRHDGRCRNRHDCKGPLRVLPGAKVARDDLQSDSGCHLRRLPVLNASDAHSETNLNGLNLYMSRGRASCLSALFIED